MFTIRGLTPNLIAKLLAQRPIVDLTAPQCVFFCIADHFEPLWQHAPRHIQQDRVDRWVRRYPALADNIRDVRGRCPQHTFFYPIEQYRSEYLDSLAALTRQSYGDVEIHLHHHNDSSEHLREELSLYTEKLHKKHGLLHPLSDGSISYGFIHGNWSLDNSHPDGDWCGVDDELDILRETGCYADFTLPSAPSPCQTSTVNSIYYAVDAPESLKSHDVGIPAELGREPPANSLLMIQGPLAFDWRQRKWLLRPSLENGDLQGTRGPSFARFKLWLSAGVSVVGQPNWRFVKIHTHGCDDANAEILLGEPMKRFHQSLADHTREHPGFRYYYVTAYEMAMLVHQAEQGLTEPVFPVESAFGSDSS